MPFLRNRDDLQLPASRTLLTCFGRLQAHAAAYSIAEQPLGAVPQDRPNGTRAGCFTRSLALCGFQRPQLPALLLHWSAGGSLVLPWVPLST